MKSTDTTARRDDSGVVLVAVVCFAAIAGVLAAGLVAESMTQIRLARRQVNMEQAFYTAEGGAEIAVSYIRNGGAVPGLVTGVVGGGAFQALVVGAGPSSGNDNMTTHDVGGAININPNNAPDNQFMLVKPDGTTITRADLHNDNTVYDGEPCVYYEGPAVMIRVQPKGAGNQNSLTIDGVPYTMANGHVYELVGLNMNVQIFNDKRNNGNGRAMGKWWVGNIDGSGVVFNEDTGAGPGPAVRKFTIMSSGRVGDAERMVILEGVHQQSWARYALWYNHSGGPIWIRDGEVFDGPVHANTQIYLQGDPVFNALVSSTAAAWGPGSVLAAVLFNQGFRLNAPVQSMASVDFNDLRSVSSLVVTGLTHITFAHTNMLVSNARRGWTNHSMALPSDGVVYVEDAAGGADRFGTIRVGGVLDGRLTLVADRDIRVTNHVHYAVHPTNDSSNALGLIAQRDVVVDAGAPNDLDIYAHIIAANPAVTYAGGFYVQNYNTRPNSGALTVYGGIVQRTRGAVGLVSGQGFLKNYIYDRRFATKPPPHYPTVDDEYRWEGWRERF